MSYIYPHSNPEIKTGSMALYREKKPDNMIADYKKITGNYNYKCITCNEIKIGDKRQHICFECYEKTALEHWQQSFIAYLKEPDFNYGDRIYHQLKGEIDHFLTVDNFNLLNLPYLREAFSHYCPGQQVESFKYVRMVQLNPNAFEWQEVEEHTQFQADKKSAKILAEI